MNPAQEMAGQMRHTHPGQDEKAGIVGHEVEVGGSGVRLPADKGVARGGFPGGGTEEEAGQICPERSRTRYLRCSPTVRVNPR